MGVPLIPDVIFVLALSLLAGAVYTSILLSRMERNFRKVCISELTLVALKKLPKGVPYEEEAA